MEKLKFILHQTRMSGGTAKADDAVSSENVLILDTLCRQGKDQTR